MKILAISWKDALLRFSSRMELLFFLVLPIIFTFLLGGGAVGGGAVNISILVVDDDQSTLSTQLVKILTASQAVEVKQATAEQAATQFENRDAPVWLVIPDGFGAALLAGEQGELEIHREPNNSSADAAERAVFSATSALNRQIQTARFSLAEAERLRQFGSEDEKKAYFEASLAAAQAQYAAQPERVQVQQVISTAPQYDQRAQASIGQMVLWVLIPLLGISVLFAEERNGKTLQRLITTPTRRSTFMSGTITGQLALAIVQMAILIIFGVYVMKVSWGNSVLGLAIMMIAFGLASVAMGATLGTFTKTSKQANNLSIMLGMVMGFMGGCGWPIELFPPFMQKAAMVLPTYWAMQGFTDLAMRGEGVSAIWLEAGVLVLFAVVFFIIGVRRFRYD